MPRRHKYNDTYLPPLAFIDHVPGLGFTLGWAFRVLVQLIRVIINGLTYRFGQSLDDLSKDVAAFEAHVQKDQYMRAGVRLVGILRQLSDYDEDCAACHDTMLRISGKRAFLENEIFSIIEKLCRKLHEQPAPDSFDSLKDYNDMFVTIPLPSIAKTFQTDEAFAWMRVAGPNPMVLARLNAPKANFPVNDTIYQAVMGTDDNLAAAISDGRVYIADYARLNGALAGSYPKEQKYMAAPMAMFAVPKSGPTPRKLVPVAIQCQQEPGPKNPIFSPPTSANDTQATFNWTMAKTAVQTADGNYHEAISHLGQTHLVIEPFVVATLNNLDEDHPVGKLLSPHFEGTLLINNLAQSSLIAAGGTVDTVMQGTIDQDRVLASLGTMSILRDFNHQGPLESLQQRQVADTNKLPYYPYRDAALAVFDAIAEWVTGYVAVYYPNQDDPAADAALQDWLSELLAHDGGRLANVGEDGGIKTRDYLAKLLSKVIFIASAQHAAVNFPQKSVMSYTPAMPLANYTPAPDGRTLCEQTWFAQLPPKQPTTSQMNIGQLLGGVYYTQLGQYDADHFDKQAVKDLLAAFQHQLAKLDNTLANQFPDYPHLRPSRIPQSINI